MDVTLDHWSIILRSMNLGGVLSVESLEVPSVTFLPSPFLCASYTTPIHKRDRQAQLRNGAAW